jgi:hypothetical protein
MYKITCCVLFHSPTIKKRERERIEALIFSLHISEGCKSSFSDEVEGVDLV